MKNSRYFLATYRVLGQPELREALCKNNERKDLRNGFVLRVHTALVKDPHLIPSTHMRQLTDSCNSGSQGSDTPDFPVRRACMELKGKL